MVADEEEEIHLRDGTDIEDRTVGEHGEALRCRGVDEVGVSAGDCADLMRIGAGPDSSGNDGVLEAQSAGGEKLGGVGIRPHKQFKGSALDFFSFAREDEMARRQD